MASQDTNGHGPSDSNPPSSERKRERKRKWEDADPVAAPAVINAGALVPVPVLGASPPALADFAASLPSALASLQNDNKLYVGGVPSYVTDDQLKEVLAAFGPLKSFHYIKDNDGTPKGYAFFEYQDDSIVDAAIQGLNGIEMGDKHLKVQRASEGARQAAPQVPASLAFNLANLQNIIPPPTLAMYALRVPAVCLCASRIVQFINMVTPEVLWDDEDVNDIKEDIINECNKHGRVTSIEIPRPARNGATVPGVGKVFVEFDDVIGAKKARYKLSGRQFDGRTVTSSFFPEKLYYAKSFGVPPT
eukprot:GILK01007274.1.p1 GENE.GILK01007274.1~~GILK01007274.1.p1  ORF type:complete len:304 (-),score=48.86 GILK01007274.1:157-1068(-)